MPDPDELPLEFNHPLWKGCICICMLSLVNFASIVNLEVEHNLEFSGIFKSPSFLVTTFCLSAAILILGRFQHCCDKDASDKFNFTKAMDGKVEGWTLVVVTFWWIVGEVPIMQV